MRKDSVLNHSTLQSALEWAARAQINGDYLAHVTEVAGGFLPAIRHIFPDHLQLVYLLTSHQRRHAWHIWLAHKPESAWRDYDKGLPHPLTEWFLTAKTRCLIEDACGDLPQYIFPVLGRLPNHAGRIHTYVELCSLLKTQTGLAQELVAECTELPFDLIGILAELPPILRHVAIARRFSRRGAVTELLSCLQVMGYSAAEGLPATTLYELRKGRKVGDVMRDLFHARPFPQQVLPDSEKVRYLNTAKAMIDAGRRYANCLASQVGDAIANRRQFYEWLDPLGEGAIFALRNDEPFGFLLSEMAHASNSAVNDRVDAEITEHLAEHGILHRASAWEMMEGLESDSIRWRLRAGR